MNRLGKSIVYRGFRKVLAEQFGTDIANQIWQEANYRLEELDHIHPEITGDSKMMILPAAALYLALET